MVEGVATLAEDIDAHVGDGRIVGLGWRYHPHDHVLPVALERGSMRVKIRVGLPAVLPQPINVVTRQYVRVIPSEVGFTSPWLKVNPRVGLLVEAEEATRGRASCLKPLARKRFHMDRALQDIRSRSCSC